MRQTVPVWRTGLLNNDKVVTVEMDLGQESAARSFVFAKGDTHWMSRGNEVSLRICFEWKSTSGNQKVNPTRARVIFRNDNVFRVQYGRL